MKAATLSQSTSRIPQPAPSHTRAGPRIAHHYPNQYTSDHMRRSAFQVVLQITPGFTQGAMQRGH